MQIDRTSYERLTSPTWNGVAYVIDVFSWMIIWWRAATNMQTDISLDALAQALWARKVKET